MRVSTKGRYGLKAMIFIASNATENQCVSLRNIAEYEGISENYLEQLISTLKKNNLVKSVRGAKGGYTLALPMEDISVGDVLRVLEGSLSPVDCLNDDGSKSCNCGTNCGDDCMTREIWQKIDEGVSKIVDNINLDELVNKYKSDKGSDN